MNTKQIDYCIELAHTLPDVFTYTAALLLA